MKIKQNEAVKAYKSLQDLNHVKISSWKAAKQIYELFKKFKPAYDFQVQEEQKIFFLHPDFDMSIGGIKLTDDKEQHKKAIAETKQIEKELDDLGNLDFEIEDFDSPIEINLGDEPYLKLSGEDIGNLEKLINFT